MVVQREEGPCLARVLKDSCLGTLAGEKRCSGGWGAAVAGLAGSRSWKYGPRGAAKCLDLFYIYIYRCSLFKDGGEDVAIQPLEEEEVLCRRSDVLWALEEAPEESARQSLARAPRPVLHLLRSKDLAKVKTEQREEIYEHNEQLLESMGLDAFEDLIRQCG